MTTPMPATMRAVQYDGYGGSDVLSVRTLPLRSPAPNEVLVRVHASGEGWSDAFGFADLRSRRKAEVGTVYHLFSGTKLFTAASCLVAERHSESRCSTC